jgi:hypothetical protein
MSLLNFKADIKADSFAIRPTEGLEYKLHDGDESFYECVGLGGATKTDIVIPPTYNELPVVVGQFGASYTNENGDEISDGSKERLTSVVISDGINSINNSAFSECTALRHVTIGNTITEIPASAFYGCTKLAGIVIPNSVRTIGSNAFENCDDLKVVTLPKGVDLDESSFSGCTKLIFLSDGTPDPDIGIYGRPVYTNTSFTLNTSSTSIADESKLALWAATAMNAVNAENATTAKEAATADKAKQADGDLKALLNLIISYMPRTVVESSCSTFNYEFTVDQVNELEDGEFSWKHNEDDDEDTINGAKGVAEYFGYNKDDDADISEVIKIVRNIKYKVVISISKDVLLDKLNAVLHKAEELIALTTRGVPIPDLGVYLCKGTYDETTARLDIEVYLVDATEDEGNYYSGQHVSVELEASYEKRLADNITF